MLADKLDTMSKFLKTLPPYVPEGKLVGYTSGNWGVAWAHDNDHIVLSVHYLSPAAMSMVRDLLEYHFKPKPIVRHVYAIRETLEDGAGFIYHTQHDGVGRTQRIPVTITEGHV